MSAVGPGAGARAGASRPFRPWFDTTGAQTPFEAAVAPLRLVLDPVVDSRLYGELVRFGQVVPWRASAVAL